MRIGVPSVCILSYRCILDMSFCLKYLVSAVILLFFFEDILCNNVAAYMLSIPSL